MKFDNNNIMAKESDCCCRYGCCCSWCSCCYVALVGGMIDMMMMITMGLPPASPRWNQAGSCFIRCVAKMTRETTGQALPTALRCVEVQRGPAHFFAQQIADHVHQPTASPPDYYDSFLRDPAILTT